MGGEERGDGEGKKKKQSCINNNRAGLLIGMRSRGRDIVSIRLRLPLGTWNSDDIGRHA